ncbi:MAG: hypothetical protein JXD21_01630 [Candidatus Omnitrophica bacterium]|nr:hypothetical protein [Candidatus Omnitrophota bacterium]
MLSKKEFFIAGICILLAGCMGGAPDVVIDSFEEELNASTVDYGSGEGAQVTVSASKEFSQCGNQSLKIEYNLTPSGYMWIARGYGLDVKGAAAWTVSPQEVSWKKYNALEVSMYGAGSGAVIAFDVKDAQGEYWRFLLSDDVKGWKDIVCPFAHFFPRHDWQPETAQLNDIMDFPIMSFQFEPRLPGKGVYYFDCVKIIHTQVK